MKITQHAIDSRRMLLKDLTGLQLWYVIQVAGDEQREFVEVLNQRTELYSYSEFFAKDISAQDNDPWQTVVQTLHRLWIEGGGQGYEDAAWSVLEKHFEPSIVPSLVKTEACLASSFAGFTYEFHPEYFGLPQPDFLTLHFRNYFSPDSPFHHRRELITALLQIIDEAHEQRPDITRVQCASWLNNIPPFYDLFPRSWIETSTVCPIEGHNGWWGQFVNRYGQLHRHNAAHLKQAKTFLYPNRHCRCDLRQLKQHLETMVSETW